MTLHVYRYRQNSPVLAGDLTRKVAPSAVVIDAAGGAIFDIRVDDVDSNALVNLDEYMTRFGFSRIATDPVGSPSSQVRLADGTILTFLTPADTQFLRRNGTNIDGAAASSGGYALVQEDGTPLTARTILNFQNGIVATDDGPGTRTNLNLDYGLVGDIVQVDAGDAASAGISARAARADHQHGVGTAAVGDLAVADAAAAAAGASTNIPRADHKHQVSTAVPSVTVRSEATAAAVGSAASVLRTDAQIQALTAAPSTNILSDASTVAQGVSSALLRADARLLAVTAAPVAVDTAANAQGTSTSLARADHKHQVTTASPSVTVKSEATAASTGAAASVLRTDAQIQAQTAVPVAVGTALAQGASSSLARADHVHTSTFPVLQWGNNSVAATTTTRYLTPGYTDSSAQTAVFQFRSPRAGTLRNLRVRHNTPAGNGLAIVYRVRINGVASALTVSLASTSSDVADTTNSAAVAAGDLIDIEVTKAASVGTSPGEIIAVCEMTP